MLFTILAPREFLSCSAKVSWGWPCTLATHAMKPSRSVHRPVLTGRGAIGRCVRPDRRTAPRSVTSSLGEPAKQPSPQLRIVDRASLLHQHRGPPAEFHGTIPDIDPRLPSRVVVWFVLALTLFAGQGTAVCGGNWRTARVTTTRHPRRRRVPRAPRW
jgi:hypothetical protein